MAQRKHHGGAFKTRVVVEAIAGHKTVNEIASAYEIHPSQVGKWKAEALARLPEVLADGRKVKADSGAKTEAGLYEEIEIRSHSFDETAVTPAYLKTPSI